MRTRLTTWLKRIAIGLAVLVAAAAIPVLWVETSCVASPRAGAGQAASLLDPADRRDGINSYLTYPEWSIVHAYEDLAAVTRAGSESDYPYFAAIGRTWSSQCDIFRIASSRGTIPSEYRVMLHVIGLSFAAEMGIKGLYEETVGWITALIRGDRKTPEDEFALAVADDYAAFLRQTPWYEYPFGATLARFWTETPLTGGNPIRKLERRLALSVEWGVKSLYARLIGMGAASMPAALRIRSVVAGVDATDMAADPRITIVRELPGGASVIETDRYRTFTEIMRGLARRGRNFVEIAGNRHILVTVKVPAHIAVDAPGVRRLFDVPIAALPGWRREALDVEVERLLDFMRRIEGSPILLEHVYDY